MEYMLNDNEDFPDFLTQIALVEDDHSEELVCHLADMFEDDLIEYDMLPDTHFVFFLTLLSNAQYYNKQGIWRFVSAVGITRETWSTAQRDDIIAVLVDNYEKYSNKMLCLSVCDFVARYFDPAIAADVLKKFKLREQKKEINLQGFADEGFFILGQEVDFANNGNIPRSTH
jgi:hypothetical protein